MFNITLAGVLGNDVNLIRLTDELFGQIKAYLFTKEAEPEIKILVSDEYTDESWKDKISIGKNPVCVISDTYRNTWQGDSRISFETKVRRVVGEMLCNKSDLVIAVWNETPSEMNGATWELVQLARENGTPLVWISSETGKTYWCKEAFYEPYTPEKLKNVCEKCNEKEIKPMSYKKTHIPFLGIGRFLYEHYTKKYSFEEETEVHAQDAIMQQNFSEMEEDSSGGRFRKKLYERFISYDEPAILFGEKYQSVIYWRSVLPIVATFFIAVGFYAESILGIIPAPKNFWPVVAAFGFLIHAFVNLYVYILSKSEKIKKMQENCANSRYIAEIFRVIMHFEPYGISLNLKKLCGGNNGIYTTVRNSLDNNESFTLNKDSAKKLLSHLDEMIENQICYHKKSERKYEKIVKHLEKYGKVFMIVSFVTVVLRSMFRFLLIITGGHIGSVVFGGLSEAFANMLALVVPAVATYFTSKLSLCNFEYNYNNHKKMAETLEALSQRVKNIIKLDSEMTMEIIGTLGQDVACALLLDDANSWHRQYMSLTIKRL